MPDFNCTRTRTQSSAEALLTSNAPASEDLSAIHWYKMQTCRIDGLNKLAMSMSSALKTEIVVFQGRSWHRLLRMCAANIYDTLYSYSLPYIVLY